VSYGSSCTTSYEVFKGSVAACKERCLATPNCGGFSRLGTTCKVGGETGGWSSIAACLNGANGECRKPVLAYKATANKFCRQTKCCGSKTSGNYVEGGACACQKTCSKLFGGCAPAASKDDCGKRTRWGCGDYGSHCSRPTKLPGGGQICQEVNVSPGAYYSVGVGSASGYASGSIVYLAASASGSANGGKYLRADVKEKGKFAWKDSPSQKTKFRIEYRGTLRSGKTVVFLYGVSCPERGKYFASNHPAGLGYSWGRKSALYAWKIVW